jgi:hypothetical protein
MIHYFNPGHETAVLNGSKFYRPTVRVLKMQEDLAFLPTWYAAPNDYVLLPGKETDLRKEELRNQTVDLWGISPQSIYFFEKLNQQYNLQLIIPEWKEEYLFLGSRWASQKILALILSEISEIENDILPQFLSGIDEIESRLIQVNEKQLVKSPYSSSGRGLVWLPPGRIARSERQIISGMLKKQSQVSIEKALDKQLDFSMHFEIISERETKFIGYSVFQTNAKGAYEKSTLANQDELEKQITRFISADLLLQVKKTLTNRIQKIYSPYYKGNIGVDMLIYQSKNGYKLNPCIEINMRKSMGYLAIRLFDKHIDPCFKGEFVIEYNSDPAITYQKHVELQQKHPPVFENGRLRSGYLNLCPVAETTLYHAYILS